MRLLDNKPALETISGALVRCVDLRRLAEADAATASVSGVLSIAAFLRLAEAEILPALVDFVSTSGDLWRYFTAAASVSETTIPAVIFSPVRKTNLVGRLGATEFCGSLASKTGSGAFFMARAAETAAALSTAGSLISGGCVKAA